MTLDLPKRHLNQCEKLDWSTFTLKTSKNVEDIGFKRILEHKNYQ